MGHLDDVKHSIVLLIVYKNWRGETATRRVCPLNFYLGTSEHHTETQWLMKAMDLDKGVERHFALKDVLAWDWSWTPDILET